VSDARSPLRIVHHVATPYGAAFLAAVAEFLAGGAAGAGIQPLFWVLHILMGLMVMAWLWTVVLTIRGERLLGLIALPSALLILAISTDIPLLAGGCMLGHECV